MLQRCNTGLQRCPCVSWPPPLILVVKGRVLSALSNIAMQWQLGDLITPWSPKETPRSAAIHTHSGPPRKWVKWRFNSPESLGFHMVPDFGSENKQREFLPSAPRPNKTDCWGWAYAEMGSREFITAGSNLVSPGVCERLKISAWGFWSSYASFWGWVNFMAIIRRLHYSFLLFLPKMSDKFSC